MPFPLAHPAAVLPLRRFCPRFLSLPALVIGSLCPDAGYAFSWLGADALAHRLVGSFLFCLPVGLLLAGLFAISREWILRLVPGAYQAVFQPLRLLIFGSPPLVVLSILIGTWTHMFLDSFTNDRGEAAVMFEGLQVSLGSVAGHHIRACHLLWYGFSFGGVAWLLLAYQGWMVRVSTGALSWRPRARNMAEALLLAALVLPIGVVHHLWGRLTGCLMVAGLSVAWGLAVVVSMARLVPFKASDGLPLNPEGS